MTTPPGPQQGHTAQTVRAAEQQSAPPVPPIPQQWAPAGFAPRPIGWAPVPPPAPRNGLGIAALCLGVVGLLFGLVPFTGFIAFALGAVGAILGLVGFARARRGTATNLKTAVSGTVLSALAIALGIWGMVIVFTGLNQLAEDLQTVPTASAPAVVPQAEAAAPAPVDAPTYEAPGYAAPTYDAPSYEAPSSEIPADETPAYGTPSYGSSSYPLPAYESPAAAGPVSYRLEVTGTAAKMMVGYGTNSASSMSGDYQALPWNTTVEASGDYPSAYLSASSSGPGSITCTITDTTTGDIVSTRTSQSLDDSEYGSAHVSCSTY
ncbi:hypothetical protein JOF36_000196 [Pseudonocardia parietis]|uniref:MmpS family membrane protein n=1 Tax=Pseudonocardia parietis TaxID=570936 RepID=A0ABS4VKQ2_9PSEU|nr:threonine/serine exporter family protein [Pseudonocardia parietis]MBP2364500.1 hypothetical protein [Pseudonocardia parietis]